MRPPIRRPARPLRLSRQVRARALHSTPSPSTSTSTSTAQVAQPLSKPAHPEQSSHSPITLPPRLVVKNVLKEAASILRRVGEGDVPWALFAERAASDLGESRSPRIAVVGDRLAGMREFVTALLDDPLSVSHRRKAIWARWEGEESEVVRIRHGSVVSSQKGELVVPAAWLEKDGCELYEVVSQDLTKHLPLLLTMDSILLVTDSSRLLTPLTSLLPHLPVSPLAPTSLQLIINRPANHSFSYTPSEEDTRVAAALEGYYRGSPYPSVTTVSSTLALEALEAFQSSASPSTEAVRTFQAKYMRSRISQLQTALSRPLPEDFQVNTAAGLASAALGAGAVALVDAEQEADRARRKALWLQGESERELGKWTGVEGLKDQAERARQGVSAALRRFAFWKLVWRVDDLGAEVRETVERVYGRELERKLSYDAGRLKELQSQYTHSTAEVLELFASPSQSTSAPFHSPLLENKLAQLTSLTQLQPSSLLYPIFHRRQQLTQRGGPIDHLHLRAQNLVLTGWASFLASPIAGILGWTMYDVQGSTAVAAVGLVWAGTAWWCQGRWEKGLSKFWQDWDRVEKGLDVDLKNEIQDVVRTKVLAKPLTAAEGIQELVSRREAVLGPIRQDLRNAQKKLDEVVSR